MIEDSVCWTFHRLIAFCLHHALQDVGYLGIFGHSDYIRVVLEAVKDHHCRDSITYGPGLFEASDPAIGCHARNLSTTTFTAQSIDDADRRRHMFHVVVEALHTPQMIVSC
jgi:hypothetical protein